MRTSVRGAFLGFTAPLEGVVSWMYLDIIGKVTVAVGNLIDPIDYALELPFVDGTGTQASRDTIGAEWHLVKNHSELAARGYRAAEHVTRLRLTDEGVQQVVLAKLDEMDGDLARRFAGYPDWHADAQLATLSLAWACGPGFAFPRLEAALRSEDFATAATECRMNEDGNPGLKPRNAANRTLYLNADRARALGLDAEALQWPVVLAATAPTEPPL